MDNAEHGIVKWNEDRCRQAYELALLGANDKQIANVMGVNIMTIDYWKRTREDFRDALNTGKIIADATVANSLYKCANGYTLKKQVVHVVKGRVVVTTIDENVGPNPWAAYKWLSVRERALWSETHKVEVTNTNVNINKFDFEGITEEEIKLLYSLGIKQQALNASNDHENQN